MPVICPQHSELGDLETVRRRSVKPLRFRRPAGHGGTVLASLGATSNPWIISPQAPIILAKWLSDPIVSQVWAYYSGGISAASAVAQVQLWATPGFVPPSSNFSYSVGSPNGATIPGYKDAQGRTIKAYAAVQMWPAAGGMYGAVPALQAYVTSLVGGNLLTQVANPQHRRIFGPANPTRLRAAASECLRSGCSLCIGKVGRVHRAGFRNAGNMAQGYFKPIWKFDCLA